MLRWSLRDFSKEADIHRTTFYNHYRGIWEIIEVIEGEIMDRISAFLVGFRFSKFMKDPYPTLSALNRIIEEKPEYYQKLYERSASRFFIEKLKGLFQFKLLKDSDFLKAYKKQRKRQRRRLLLCWWPF